MPRFVLLHHECPPSFPRPSHWDFMLERGGILQTWVLVELPANWQTSLGMDPSGPRNNVPVQKIGDHRPEYLTIEGPLSGERGAVRRIEQGDYSIVAESDGLLEVRLSGDRLQGIAKLSREAGGDHWSLAWRSG